MVPQSKASSMTTPKLSYEELEALHDVLEAARCYWHKQPLHRDRATKALVLVNKLYWRLGEQLPKTGTPSERFLPVIHRTGGTRVEELVNVALDLTREYANNHDPWWADTIIAPERLASVLSPEEFSQLTESLRRLGLSLELSDEIPPNQFVAKRRDQGPWPDDLSF